MLPAKISSLYRKKVEDAGKYNWFFTNLIAGVYSSKLSLRNSKSVNAESFAFSHCFWSQRPLRLFSWRGLLKETPTFTMPPGVQSIANVVVRINLFSFFLGILSDVKKR